jgi:hypothetical protein
MFGGCYFGQTYPSGQVQWVASPTPPPPVPVPEVVTLPDHTGGSPTRYRRDEYEWPEILRTQVRERALVRNESDIRDIVQLVRIALEELCR